MGYRHRRGLIAHVYSASHLLEGGSAPTPERLRRATDASGGFWKLLNGTDSGAPSSTVPGGGGGSSTSRELLALLDVDGNGTIELADFTAACGQVAGGLLATSYQLGGVLRGGTVKAIELSSFAAGKGVELARSATQSVIGTGEQAVTVGTRRARKASARAVKTTARVRGTSRFGWGCCCPFHAVGYPPRPLSVSPDWPSSAPEPPQGGEAHRPRQAAMERD